jgi:hypothetical protein
MELESPIRLVSGANQSSLNQIILVHNVPSSFFRIIFNLIRSGVKFQWRRIDGALQSTGHM